MHKKCSKRWGDVDESKGNKGNAKIDGRRGWVGGVSKKFAERL